MARADCRALCQDSGPLGFVVFFVEAHVVGHFPPRLFVEFVPASLLVCHLDRRLETFPPQALYLSLSPGHEGRSGPPGIMPTQRAGGPRGVSSEYKSP